MRSLRGVEQSGNSLENNEKTVLTQACRKELQKMGDSTTIGRPRNSENGTEPLKPDIRIGDPPFLQRDRLRPECPS